MTLTDALNVPIDDLHRDCLEARDMIRALHAEARHRLGLDRPADDRPVERAVWVARLARLDEPSRRAS